MIPLRVLGDRVLVRPLENPNTTESGLFLPENRAETYAEMQGTVVAVGTPRHPRKEEAEERAYRLDTIAHDAIDSELPLQDRNALPDASRLLRDLVRREPCVSVGDHVLFSWSAGQRVTIDDDVFLILRESDLLAVLESA